MSKTIRNVGKTPVTVTEDLGTQGLRPLFTLEPGEQREVPMGTFNLQGPSGTFIGTEVDTLDRPNQCGRRMFFGSMEDFELCELNRGHEGAHICGDDEYILLGPMSRMERDGLRKALRRLTE